MINNTTLTSFSYITQFISAYQPVITEIQHNLTKHALTKILAEEAISLGSSTSEMEMKGTSNLFTAVSISSINPAHFHDSFPAQSGVGARWKKVDTGDPFN